MGLFRIKGFEVTWFTLVVASMASMGGLIFGYDTGQISDILLMPDFLLRFAPCKGNTGDPVKDCAFQPAIAGLVVGLLSIGTAIGALACAPIADRIGRRRVMSVMCLIFTVGVIIQVTAFTKWEQISIGRFIAGIGVGGLSVAVPMYQAETAPKQIRGTLTATYQLFITLGILVAYLFCLATRPASGSASWRIPIALGLLWSTFLGVGILAMPESPRWLIRNDRDEEARASLRKAYPDVGDGPDTVEGEFREIKAGIMWERQQPKATWADCFRPHNKTLYRTILGISLQTLQQLTGVNTFFYYGATIFQSVGIQDSFITQIILGSINFVTTFLGLYILERYGRRLPLIYGALWQSAWLFVFGAAGTAIDPSSNKGIGTLMIVSASFFILGFASTWGPGIWILMGEMFPTRTRAKQAAMGTAANWFWNFMIAYFTPFITKAINFSYGFIFAGCNLAAAIVVAFFVYESGGLSLEAVDRMYNDREINPWNSRRVARKTNFSEKVDGDDSHLRGSAEHEKKKNGVPQEQWREHAPTNGHATAETSPERV
ncbi:general substrate transporter [Exidia glandulosa HHB12029]|uniref:General substrate transporter n=1 Tax=Exidia glandulosa HHB12029 TaxID=1314781 RepID=A0A165N0H4_EXIGL|nr:general substrate transporter [Exidia glandulosa HHB12029]